MAKNYCIGEGPGKDDVTLWGRVKDSRGNYLEGALVVLTSHLPVGEEKHLGHTYTNRQGLYMLVVSAKDLAESGGKARIMALAEPPPEVKVNVEASRRLYPMTGERPALEYQIINYYRLKAVATHRNHEVTIEALPETVKVSLMRDCLAGASVYALRGRGYIASDDDQGEGVFNITICTIGSGLKEQELVRMVTVPEDKSKKKLFFDSGSIITDLFY
ncbi:MAG: hypothetical protein ACOY46_15545 [Bacillota bacterium]